MTNTEITLRLSFAILAMLALLGLIALVTIVTPATRRAWATVLKRVMKGEVKFR